MCWTECRLSTMITFATMQQVHDAYSYYCMLYQALYADALQCSNTGTSADKAKISQIYQSSINLVKFTA